MALNLSSREINEEQKGEELEDKIKKKPNMRKVILNFYGCPNTTQMVCIFGEKESKLVVEKMQFISFPCCGLKPTKSPRILVVWNCILL